MKNYYELEENYEGIEENYDKFEKNYEFSKKKKKKNLRFLTYNNFVEYYLNWMKKFMEN